MLKVTKWAKIQFIHTLVEVCNNLKASGEYELTVWEEPNGTIIISSPGRVFEIRYHVDEMERVIRARDVAYDGHREVEGGIICFAPDAKEIIRDQIATYFGLGAQ